VSLPHALLGLINYQPSTGYDLKTNFRSRFIFSGMPPCPYLPVSEADGKEGWIASTIEQQSGKPNRKVYRITGEGKEELLLWLAEPPAELEMRHSMLVKVFSGSSCRRNVLQNLSKTGGNTM